MAPTDRHEAAPRGVVAGMETDGDSHVWSGVAQLAHLLGQSDRGDGDPTGRDIEPVGIGEELQGTDHGVGVQEGLAHPHVNDVPPALGGLRSGALGEQHLGGHFAGGEVPAERDGAGAAEGAGEGTADLGGDADRQVGGGAVRSLGSP